MKYFDISYQVNRDTVIYPGNPCITLERVQDIEKGDSANVSRITIGSHTGTHIDAPAHFIKAGATIDQIPLERMNGKAKVIDATGRDEIDESFLWEIGIEKDDIILFKTDNSSNWKCDRILDDYVTLTYDAAEYLVGKEIKLVGIDYLTIERPRNKRVEGRSVHKSLLGSSILICEALKLQGISSGIHDLICIPLNIVGVDGCPVRCVLRDELLGD